MSTRAPVRHGPRPLDEGMLLADDAEPDDRLALDEAQPHPDADDRAPSSWEFDDF